MPVPSKRRSRSKARRRRSHQALKTPTLTVCKKCGKTKKPHIMCQFCKSLKS